MNETEQKNHKTAITRLEHAFVRAILAEEKSRVEGLEDLKRGLELLRDHFGLEDDRVVAQLKRYSDHGDKLLADIMLKFMGKLTWRDRLRWIFTGRVKG